MTDNNHPITPPEEVIDKWESEWHHCRGEDTYEVFMAKQAARWGADQELEACCADLRMVLGPNQADWLRSVRRPKPPSLKEQALETVQRLSKNGFPCNYQDDADWDTIRRALESLPE